MNCNLCGLENPNQSKFCRKCGAPLGVHLKCPQCGSNNPGDSLFCIVCGARLSGIHQSVKGIKLKCKNCGHFNELDALFCIACGEEMIRAPKGHRKQESRNPSHKMIALVIGMIFILGIFIKVGITFFKAESPSELISAAVQPLPPVTKVDDAQVLAVARNFKCACGGCGELPLATCQCEMSRGSVEEKGFIREKLAEGFTVEQVIKFLDKKYGHRA